MPFEEPDRRQTLRPKGLSVRSGVLGTLLQLHAPFELFVRLMRLSLCEA
jgi:hypothetical protein